MIPRSARLLGSLIAAREFTAEELAGQLLVPLATLEQYVAATMVMPLSRQMLLAKFVIARSASQKRAGHMLHGQVVAALGFENKSTTSHSGPRQTWTGRRKR